MGILDFLFGKNKTTSEEKLVPNPNPKGRKKMVTKASADQWNKKNYPLRLSESKEKLIHKLFDKTMTLMQHKNWISFATFDPNCAAAEEGLVKIIKIAEEHRDLFDEEPKPIIDYNSGILKRYHESGQEYSFEYTFNIVDLYYLMAIAKLDGNKSALNDINSALSINPLIFKKIDKYYSEKFPNFHIQQTLSEIRNYYNKKMEELELDVELTKPKHLSPSQSIRTTKKKEVSKKG